MWNSYVQATEVEQRRIAVSSKCFQLYCTCSDRLLAVVLPPCSFHLFPLLLWRFQSSQLFCFHYKCNGSWVFSAKQNMNSKLSTALQIPIFWIQKNIVLLNVVHTLKMYKNTQCHGPTLSGASIVSTSEFWTRYFWVVEAMALKNMTSRPPWMARPLYWISFKIC
jgi:hypothetical protein